MGAVIDLRGKMFGRLQVVERCGSEPSGSALWLCRCDCGNECKVSSSNLRKKHTQSCGCLQRERTSAALTKHGKRHTKLYAVWNSMIGRCNRKNSTAFRDYGGRGISVCEEWMCFPAFHEWAIKSGYREGLSLDRIDVNGNYEPGNCRWASRVVQANNTRKNVFLECFGQSHTASEWSRIYGIKYATLLKRVRKGWSVEDALTTPIRGVKK